MREMPAKRDIVHNLRFVAWRFCDRTKSSAQWLAVMSSIGKIPPLPPQWIPPKPRPLAASIRNFTADVEEMAKEYAADVFCDEEFEIIGGRAGGGSIAFPVRLKTSGRLAWVKPAVAAGQNARTAAHEKIVADVGYALGFPVAPVALNERTKGHGLPEVVALSFATLKQPRPWNGIKGALTNDHKAALSPQLAAILALHCLIDDHDHNWNEGNALFEIESGGAARTVFYDYGHSLTHEWTPPAAAPVRDWAARSEPYNIAENTHIIHAVELLERLAVKDLQAIITRIPVSCLAPDLGKHLITALDARRTQLKTLLNLAGAP
jgi:hypothetical protein